MPDVRVQRIDGSDASVALPSYASKGAAGADVRANLEISERAHGLRIAPGGRALVPTGLKMAIPQGFEIQVRPRSGLALKYGVTLANSPGTIDSDYRGALGVILINLGDTVFTVAHGERIAQLVVAPAVRAAFRLSETLDETERGGGGFGSTGLA